MFAKLNRRQFLILSATALAGCEAAGGPPGGVPQVVDAGPAADYAANGVYDRFVGRGFFIVRNGDQLFALSSICTHRRCKLETEPDHSFYCKCHGSTFDPSGRVTRGPARRNLPLLHLETSSEGRLLVTVPRA